jgi:hypothetical protein
MGMEDRMMRWILALAMSFAFLLGAGYPDSQTVPRNAQWSKDLDYLVARLEITHPRLYANISREDFHRHADQLREAIPTASDVELFFAIQELVARIGNAHTACNPSIFNMNDNEMLKAQFRYYPVMYYPFDDGLYVAAAAEQYGAIVGRKVVRIGSLVTDEAMHKLARFVAGDNDMTILGNLPRFFLNDGQLLRYVGACDSPDSIGLRLENDDGSEFDFTITTDPRYGIAPIQWMTMTEASNNPPPLYRKRRGENYWFERLPEQRAIYLQINLMNEMDTEPFTDFCQRLFDTLDSGQAEKLIIDVRGCPGGDHIEQPLLKGILARPHIDRADHLFLIIGRITGSAAEHLTAELRQYTNATFFGEETASKPNQYGAMQRFTLPHSKLEIVCALKYFQDAEPSDYSMTSTPDVYVSRSSTDFRDNRDPVIERIFSYDSYKRLRPAFCEQMTQAYTTDGLDGFTNAYDTLKAMYHEYGFNMETLLYDDLDAWMGENRGSDEDYIEYLEFIHHELPNSIPVCYDLAWWMNESGNREEAKRLWEKCLALNPEHHHARYRLGLMSLEED